MNHIVLIGRLTRDPELKYTPGGTAVTSFDLAVNRDHKQEGQPEADFIRIIAWSKTAENCSNYLRKGSLIAVEGRLQIRNYETQDGQKKKSTEVVANRVQFLQKKSGDNSAPATGADPDLDGINLDNLPF